MCKIFAMERMIVRINVINMVFVWIENAPVKLDIQEIHAKITAANLGVEIQMIVCQVVKSMSMQMLIHNIVLDVLE